jgi:hypothetical protein
MGFIGLNTVHTDIKSIINMGMDRVELCLGRVADKDARMAEILKELVTLGSSSMNYTIHHPIFMYDYYKHDYLDSFFLHEDAEKREISFRLLEDNLRDIRGTLEERCLDNEPDYLVIHFPGVFPKAYMERGAFEGILEEGLSRISEMAVRYNVRIAFEYFGSNIMFWEPEEWIRRICSKDMLSLLTDSGHLYFASVMREFDFMAEFRRLGEKSSGFHLWTCKKTNRADEDIDATMKEFSKARPHYEIKGGKDVYGANEFYRRYHHVILSEDQYERDGWAFDATAVMEYAINRRVPIILEATPLFGGTQHYINSIKYMIEKSEAFNEDFR